MSASLEAYLARLYLDADARRAFAADPRGAASRAGLDKADVAALEQVDRVGLELTARSLRAKRATRPRRNWLARLLGYWHGGPDMVPTPRRSGRPGEAVTPLDTGSRGGADMAPKPLGVRSTPAKPECSSMSN